MSHYRFSISWPRVLPRGTIHGNVSQPGLQYYHDLIDELLANGVRPMVTLYHWDLPDALEQLGGWLNPDTADHFRDYSDLCFREFGSKVKNSRRVLVAFCVVVIVRHCNLFRRVPVAKWLLCCCNYVIAICFGKFR